MTRLPLANRFKSAGITLVLARASFDIWWQYAAAETRPQFLPAMNRFSEFFRYDQEAHWRAVVVGTCTLFDKRSDTITIPDFLRESAARGHDVSELALELDRLAPKLKKMEILRHKLFAHRDHAFGYDDVYKLAQITPDNVRHILDNALAILNAIGEFHGFAHVSFNPFAIGDTAGVLRAVGGDPKPRSEPRGG